MEDIYLDDLIKADSITAEQLEAAIRGQLRIYISGKVQDKKLTLQELDAFNKAKLQHYLVKEPEQERLDSVYYDYCKVANIYWICIKLHKDAHDSCNLGEDHADFWYDFFNLQHGLTPQAFKELKRLMEHARPGAYEFTESDIGEVGGYATVPEYTAEKLARSLVELFNDSTTHSTEIFYKVYSHIQSN